MKTLPALLLAAVVAVGLMGGVAAYRVASEPAPAAPAASAAVPTASTAPAARAHRRTVVRWAPCKPPAVRQGKACVTEEVRTVVVPAPAPPAAAPAIRQVRHGDDDAAEHAEPAEHAEHAEHEDGDHAEQDDDGGHAEHEDEGD
jgi:hypothetical protein